MAAADTDKLRFNWNGTTLGLSEKESSLREKFMTLLRAPV